MGTWEYRQANVGSPTGLDSEGERLMFRRAADGRLVVDYFGLEREGEHGLYYTAVEVTGFKIDPDGTVRLIVPARRLFRTRPASVENAATLKEAGFTKGELSFSGQLTGENLVVSCSAQLNDCPESRMIFRRLPPPAR
jgi:hypothetical protein